jgi:hypothetical protein
MGGRLANSAILLTVFAILPFLSLAAAATPQGGGAQQADCFPETFLCDLHGDCCSKVCVPDAAGDKRCADCAHEGQPGGPVGKCCDDLVVGAGGICEKQPPAAAGNWYDSLYLWVALAVLLSSAVIGLGYMAAKLFEVQLLEAWAKIELAELMASITIAVLCVAMIASVDTAAQFIVGEPTGNVGDIVRADFLHDEVFNDGKKAYMALAKAYFHTAKVASYAYTAGVSIAILSFSYSEAPASGLSALVADMGQGLDSIASFMMLAAAQAAFLKFFTAAAAVLLPVAIFLRSFTLTRKVGGMLLAAVIAASVVYPASFLLSREIYDDYRADVTNLAGKLATDFPETPNPPTTDIICNPFMQIFVQSPLGIIGIGGETGWFITICIPLCAIALVGAPACLATCREVINILFYIIKAVFPIFVYFYSILPYAQNLQNVGATVDKYYDPTYSIALPMVAKYSVLSLIVFLIPVIITLSTFRGLAATFGGEAQLYGLSKLV